MDQALSAANYPPHEIAPSPFATVPICCTCVSQEGEHLSSLFSPPEISSNVRPVIFCRHERTIQAVSDSGKRRRDDCHHLLRKLTTTDSEQRPNRSRSAAWLDAKIGQLADQRGVSLSPLRQDAISSRTQIREGEKTLLPRDEFDCMGEIPLPIFMSLDSLFKLNLTATLNEAIIGHDLSVEFGRFLWHAHPVRVVLKVDIVHPKFRSAARIKYGLIGWIPVRFLSSSYEYPSFHSKLSMIDQGK